MRHYEKKKNSIYIFYQEKLNLVEFTERCWLFKKLYFIEV